MSMLLLLLISAAFGYLSMQIAVSKGRSPTVWFFVGFLFTWVGLIIALIMPPTEEAAKKLEEFEKENLQEHEEVEGEVIEVSAPLSIEAIMQREWFYLDQRNDQQGPVGFEELKRLWRERQVLGNSYVWADGMHDWQQVRTNQNLKKLLSD